MKALYLVVSTAIVSVVSGSSVAQQVEVETSPSSSASSAPSEPPRKDSGWKWGLRGGGAAVVYGVPSEDMSRDMRDSYGAYGLNGELLILYGNQNVCQRHSNRKFPRSQSQADLRAAPAPLSRLTKSRMLAGIHRRQPANPRLLRTLLSPHKKLRPGLVHQTSLHRPNGSRNCPIGSGVRRVGGPCASSP
jgi:hypothetical protein